MATSERRKKLMQEKKAKKKAAMANPGHESTYAKKKRGVYPPNSPYNSIWRDQG